MENFDNDYDIVLRIFNNTCYICTLVYQTDCPLLDLKEYERIATDGHDDIIWTNYIFMATMALVVKWLRSEESKTIKCFSEHSFGTIFDPYNQKIG